jgi:hypothetical protein
VTPLRALLDEIAVPRLPGTAQHERVRATLRRELEGRGFVVLEHRFPATARFPLRGPGPAEGVNLIAVRPRTRVTTWLAAHYDSKGQPLSMALRLVWVVAGALVLAAGLATTVIGGSVLWLIPGLLLAIGFLALNVATDGTSGAVDNATGVLTVLAALDALPADAGVGALVLDAEELGLLGAKALVRDRANLLQNTTVINFDGIDDRGPTIALVHRPGPVATRVTTALGSRAWRWLPVVVDGLALAGGAAECVTIMRGNWSTMRMVHTPRDTPDRVTLDGASAVARAIASVLATP